MKHLKTYCSLTLFVLFFTSSYSQNSQKALLPLAKRAELIDSLLEDKLQNTLPLLMETTKIDMWIVISREYNEDPIIKTLLPATWLAARRRTILIMAKNHTTGKVDKMAIARYAVGKSFKKAWDKEKQPDQWKRVAEIVEKYNPKVIGINQSETYGLADGIVATEYKMLQSVLQKHSSKIISAEPLAVAWLETRTSMEMKVYPFICKVAHEIIAEAFSEKVIVPGKTSTEDVVWWMREKVAELKLDTWFHPSVSIQRSDKEKFDQIKAFSSGPKNNIIMPGDLVHCDFGITYLRLNTDTQQHAYILKEGETDAPEYLKNALKEGNRLQDIFTGQFVLGDTGNEVLKRSRRLAIAEGLQPTIYTHPIGYHGHAAGTTLGMWDAQEGVPGSGDYPLHYNTAYSIELNTAVVLKEWNKTIRIMLEEEAFFDQTGVHYIDGRQTELILIK